MRFTAAFVFLGFLMVSGVMGETDIKFDFQGLLAGAPTGCNCGEVPADCSTCVTGINGWPCRPRDCTYCSHGINGFPCGGSNCSTCSFGINGWPCIQAASVTACTLSYTTASNWSAWSRYEIVQQANTAWVKFFFQSTVPVLGVQLRTSTSQDVAWQVYPQQASQIGTTISWARLPALTMYSYADYGSSVAQFSPSQGRRAPDYIIPVTTTGLQLWVQQQGQADYNPAPLAGANNYVCTTATNFQQDALRAIATGTNF